MSSLRNAISRRTHKERGQPLERQKWGLLEKHKDYALRARDFNEKKKRLRSLRQKAAERNPDEFHFGMMSSTTHNGVKIADRGNKALSQEVVKLLKTQDAGYLRTTAQKVKKERQRLEETFLLNDAGVGVKLLKETGRQGNRTVFVDTVDNQKGISPQDWFNVDKVTSEKGWSRERRKLNGTTAAGEETDSVITDTYDQNSITAREEHFRARKEMRSTRKKLLRTRRHLHYQMATIRNQEKELSVAERELEKQRAKMTQSLGGLNKSGVQFKVRGRKR